MAQDNARIAITNSDIAPGADSALPNDDLINETGDKYSALRRGGLIDPPGVTTMTVDRLFTSLIGPWWSRNRDRRLREIAMNTDYLAIGLYNAVTKVSSIMPTLYPLDRENQIAALQAKVTTILLQQAWLRNIPSMLFDVTSQDNGGFLEITSRDSTKNTNRPLEPTQIAPGIFVPATGLRVLDSARCVRTGNPELPVRVEWVDGKEYTFHHSRIIEFAQLPSTIHEMNGVGLCAVSRVLRNMLQGGEFDQILLDMLVHGMVGEVVLVSPMNSDDISAAFKKAETRMTNPDTPHYQRYVFVGVEGFDGKLQVVRIPLRRVPDGMTKVEVVNLFMSLVASALSLDVREIWQASKSSISGATRADAEVEDAKTEQKFTKQWLTYMGTELRAKATPLSCEITFEYQDTEEINAKFTGRRILAETHKLELENGTISTPVAIQQLVANEYLTPQQAEMINIQARINTPRTTDDVARLLGPRQKNVLKKSLIPQGAALLPPVESEAQDGGAEYRIALDDLVNEYSAGIITESEFQDAVFVLTVAAMIDAFVAGSEKPVSAWTPDDFAALDFQTNILRESLPGLVALIDETPPENRSAFNFQGRLDLWENTIGRVYYAGWLFRDDLEQMVTWRRNPQKDSCTDCIAFDGQTKPLRVWRESGYYPRSTALECTGFLCGCVFEPA